MAGRLSTDWRRRLGDYNARLVPGSRRQASVLALLADLPSGPELLLTQRARHLQSHPGEVSLPGGSVESDDPTLYHTALRETREEAGLQEAPTYLGQLDSLYARSGIEVAAFVAHLPHRPQLQASPDEVAEIFWLPLDELVKQEPEYQWFERQGRQWRVPFFYHDGWTIWGMTGMILVNLINVVQGSDWPDFHAEWSANPMDAD